MKGLLFLGERVPVRIQVDNGAEFISKALHERVTPYVKISLYGEPRR